MKRTNRRTRVLIDLYPCHIEEKMTIKEVKGESVMEWKTKVTTKDGIVIKFPRKFHGYKLATEEKMEENEGLKELQNILPQIATQVTANVNNANGGNGNSGNNRSRGHEAAIAMSWNDFKALLVEEFCPSNAMEKLENEF
ncbi:hypothetical protein Tco_0719968 [Tanacetum coccineum]